MLSKKRKEIAEEAIRSFIEFTPYTVASINEGSCEEFADYLNEEYMQNGLEPHKTFSTLSFISPTITDHDHFEDTNYWNKEAMELIGVPYEFFQEFKRKVEEVDSRGLVAYHVWLFDGEHHYDATCLDGVKNPLALPFFKLFTEKH